jgi:murein DD-endopeptidase MepM/ murein hydrolase activator NlpD
MNRDERLYAFIVGTTSRSRSRIRRFSIHKRWVKVSFLAAGLVGCATIYGFYGLAQQAVHLRIEEENNRLREENVRQREKLQLLENRVDAIEDASRRLSEISGVFSNDSMETAGAGGPSIALDEEGIAALEYRAQLLEANLHKFETAINRARIPSIWPIDTGEITDTYGGRRDPFGGGSEFHSGQDIRAPRGTPIYASANGVLTLAGWKNGYGNTVVVDHGNGLTTLYGHLSKVEATLGQEVKRGDLLGLVGSTGRSTGPHLHYEVRINEVAVNPTHYLPAR